MTPKPLKVLIGCATSCVALDAFLDRGHDAWQCDILPSDKLTNRHIQDDIRNVLPWGWDLLLVSNPPCFAGDTLVLARDGYKPIREITVGEEVLTHLGRWRRVTEVMTKRTTDLVRLKSSNCLETITTSEHPYYVRYREKYGAGFRTLEQRDRPAEFAPAGKLSHRHFTCSVLPEASGTSSGYSGQDLWLMGRYVADGHLRPSRAIEGAYEEMVISVGDAKLEAFQASAPEPYSLYRHSNGTHRATFYGHERLAVFGQFGRGAENKRLPAWILSLPTKEAALFLDGYLSGDGYLRDKCQSACSVSPALILGIGVLMQRVHGKCPAFRTQAPRETVIIEGRRVSTLPLHTVEVPNSDKRLRNYVDGDRAWGHIRKVEAAAGNIIVYNLSVEEDETYTANGVVVHNCTRLCNSGVRWLSKPPTGRSIEQMWAELDEGAALFSDCLNAPIPHVACENPVMHGHAKARIKGWIKPQIVQPWWFGDPAFKATGLYLKNLPPLHATDKLTPPAPGTDAHKAWSAIHRAPPGPDRWKFRSKTFPGMARAWAEQWGDYARQWTHHATQEAIA